MINEEGETGNHLVTPQFQHQTTMYNKATTPFTEYREAQALQQDKNDRDDTH
jgi:hypothetical protein